MKYEIAYSPKAIEDLERVWSEVLKASGDYQTTEEYIDALMDKVEQKEEFPKSGSPLYYEDLFTGYYYVFYKAYKVFYRVEKDRLLIDRVLYSKSDYLRILKLD